MAEAMELPLQLLWGVGSQSEAAVELGAVLQRWFSSRRCRWTLTPRSRCTMPVQQRLSLL